MVSYGVTLLSGGLDSTTVAAYARSITDHLTALTFYYGQSHSKEVGCARKVAKVLGIHHQLPGTSFLRQVAWYSALISPDRFPVPSDRPTEQMGFSVPITYVPLRNTIFLALAAACSESQVLYAIRVEGVESAQVGAKVFVAPNAIDYSGYPDCRPQYYEKMR